MRLLTLLGFALTVAALLGAALLGPPYWYFALYCAPFFGTLFAIALATSLLEVLLGPRVRSVAPVLAVALALFAGLYALFERAPGTFPFEPLLLRGLGEKALSIAALASGVGALALGSYGLRAPGRPAQSLAVLGLTGASLALGTVPAAFGVPHLSPWLLGALAAGAGLFVVGADPGDGPSDADLD